MLDFKKVELEDKKWIDKILKSSECRTLEYNFTTFFIWRDSCNNKVAEQEGVLFSQTENKFLFPVGADAEKALSVLEKFCKEKKIDMNFLGLSPAQKEILERLYPGKYVYREDRDAEDYIYRAEDLRWLRGKKLSSKRNHINRFAEQNPDWTYEQITDENIEDVRKMHCEWCAENEHSQALLDEAQAVRYAIEYYKELELSGGLLRTGGRVVAFSMGDRLNSNTFLVHVEKAFSGVNGAYSMICKQFAINNCTDCEYIDREDDAGDAGLRKAKLSYKPCKIAEKFIAESVDKIGNI